MRCDASAHDMYYMNLSDKKLMLQKETEEVKNAQNDWDKQQFKLPSINIATFLQIVVL